MCPIEVAAAHRAQHASSQKIRRSPRKPAEVAEVPLVPPEHGRLALAPQKLLRGWRSGVMSVRERQEKIGEFGAAVLFDKRCYVVTFTASDSIGARTSARRHAALPFLLLQRGFIVVVGLAACAQIHTSRPPATGRRRG